MGTTDRAFETIPSGTNVTWHYRSAIGHGTVIGVHKIGTTPENTMYSGANMTTIPANRPSSITLVRR